MADRKSFPMLPGAHWWGLRNKFKQSIPGVVTDNYLAAALDMQARSARANVLPYLKDIGLIDEEGKIQDLAKSWRDDHQYSKVCKQIREKIYPSELLAAASNPTSDRSTAERWFANHTGAGASAVRRMVQFYTILVEADPAKANDKPKPSPLEKKTKGDKKSEVKPVKKTATSTSVGQQAQAAPSQVPPPAAPGVSINLEIQISADATPDQIDKIFESMAKHIYKK